MDEQQNAQAPPRKTFVASREFWLGVATVFFSVIIAYDTAIKFVG